MKTRSPHAISQRNLLVAFVLVTLVCGAVEFGLQQMYRRGANVPQIQIAADVAKLVVSGVDPHTITDSVSAIDIRVATTAWVAVYDTQGLPLASNARLDGALPRMPDGVFAYVAAHGEDHITWQPDTGVRQAIVVTQAGDKGYVVSGRSLADVELREDALLHAVMLAWVLSIVIILVFRSRFGW